MSAPSAAPLRIATRKSQLALWQAEHVAALLRRAHAGLEVELVPMITQGDRIQDRSLAAIGGKGLFIKELEVALEERRADIAVHSMKDVPGELPAGTDHRRGAASARTPRCAADPQRPARLEDLPRVRASAPRACGVRRSCWRRGRTCASNRCAAMSIPGCGVSTRASWMPSCWPARA